MPRSNKSGKAKKPKAKRTRNMWVARTFLANPIPTKTITKLTYPFFGLLSYTTTPGVQAFRLNSIFDPDFTAIGSQPPYRDQLAAWYYNYRVTGCKVDAEFTYGTGTTSVVVMNSDQNGAAPSDMQGEMAQVGAQYRLVAPYSPQSKFKQYFAIADVFSVEKSDILTDPAYAALMSTNPANTAFLQFSAVQVSGTAATTLAYSGKLTFYVECYGPVAQAMN